MSAPQHAYRPVFRRGDDMFDLQSNGIISLNIRSETYTVRVSSSEIPLIDGTFVFDIKRGSATVALRGVMVYNTRDDLLEKKTELVTWLTGGASTPEPFTFYTFYGQRNRRYFVDCYLNGDVSFNFGSRTVRHVEFDAQLLVPSGIEYEWVSTDSGAGNPVPPGPITNPDNDEPFVNIHLSGPRTIILKDDAGNDSFQVMNSQGVIIYKVDSLGNVQYSGIVEQTEEIT